MRGDEDSYRALVDHLPDGFARLEVVVGGDGRPVDGVFLETNPAFETLTGLRREQILGRRVTEAIPGIERSAFDWIGTCGRVALDGGGICCEQYAEPLGRWYEVTAFSDRPGQFVVVFHDITERRRQRFELDRELSRRRLLQDQSRDGIVVLDGDGRAVETNLKFARMLGYSPEEVLQLHVWDWDVPTPRERLVEMIRDVDESGDFFVTQHRRKDGSVYDVEVSTNAAVFAGQKRIFCVCRDITERKRAESALRESEERLAQLARHSRAVAWEVDLDGLFTYVSPVVEEVLGLRPDDLVGRKYFYEMPPQEAREEIKERALRAMQAGADITDFETPMVSRDGRVLWVAISGIPLKDTDGRLVGYRGWVVDMTARKTAELTLRASEERFRSLFENSIDAIFIGKPDGTVIDVNQAWLDLFGYGREDLTSFNASALYADPAERADFVRRMNTLGFVRDEVRYKRKDGSIFDCQRVQVVRRDDRGNIVAYEGILRDVSQQRRDRAELERLARFDSLTGLLNRYSILERLDEWLTHEKRYKSGLSVIMADIDRFKRVNDVHGHRTGDRVLTETAGLLQRSARETDFVGRYGGEEFLTILPRTDATGAAMVAERARLAVQRMAMHDASGRAVPVTVSFGVAEWREGDDEDSLVTRADAALYRAKAAGRNRVEIALPDERAA